MSDKKITIVTGAQTCAPNRGACEDHVLVARARTGDAGAFGELYERHRSKTHIIAYRILHDFHEAEDAVQRAFQRAFGNLSRFREDSAFSTWVTRIAINESLMMLRHKRRNTRLPENDEGGGARTSVDLSDERPSPEQVFAQTELRSSVIHAVSKLRRSLRVVVVLREIHGLTNAETARRLGLTVAAVKARAFHARRHLRKHFERTLREGAMRASRRGARMRSKQKRVTNLRGETQFVTAVNFVPRATAVSIRKYRQYLRPIASPPDFGLNPNAEPILSHPF